MKSFITTEQQAQQHFTEAFQEPSDKPSLNHVLIEDIEALGEKNTLSLVDKTWINMDKNIDTTIIQLSADTTILVRIHS